MNEYDTLEPEDAVSPSKPGPKTEEGKRRSSVNALKHGLYARSPQAVEAMTAACSTTYDEELDRMRSFYWPRDPIEDELVKRIARCVWRLALTSSMESRLMEQNPAMGRPTRSLDKLMRYERLVDIHLHRAIATLMRKREAENKNISQNGFPPRLR